jgi:hypothetical protein
VYLANHSFNGVFFLFRNTVLLEDSALIVPEYTVGRRSGMARPRAHLLSRQFSAAFKAFSFRFPQSTRTARSKGKARKVSTFLHEDISRPGEISAHEGGKLCSAA